jgi:hypothetical protein
VNARVYGAYVLKQELRALYGCGPRSAPEHLRSWLSCASRSNLAPFVKLGRTLRQYCDGVLAAIRLRLSNGRMEGLNNKIGVIEHRAYGFHPSPLSLPWSSSAAPTFSSIYRLKWRERRNKRVSVGPRSPVLSPSIGGRRSTGPLWSRRSTVPRSPRVGARSAPESRGDAD